MVILHKPRGQAVWLQAGCPACCAPGRPTPADADSGGDGSADPASGRNGEDGNDGDDDDRNGAGRGDDDGLPSAARWGPFAAQMTLLLRLLLLCAALVLTVVPAAAATVTEQIVAQLSEQGFDRISVSRTLLGRTRIQASSRDFEREIVVNPATGEILRDYIVWRRRSGGKDPQAPQIVDPYDDEDDNVGHGGGNSGRNDDESDDDDDDEDDDDKGDEDDGDDDGEDGD